MLTPNREELGSPALYQEWREPFFDLARQLGVPYLDTLPVFEQAVREGVSPFRDGVHPNPTGNAYIAKALAASLSSHFTLRTSALSN